jgi:hypothetical protein
MKSLFAPRLPAEIWRDERVAVEKRAPHLSIVNKDPRPDPDMFSWRDVGELFEARRAGRGDEL